MKPSEILRAARAKITDPKRWAQGVGARDTFGRQVAARCESAVCWCSIGAICAVEGVTFAGDDVLDYLRTVSGESSVVDFNDAPERTHDEVLQAFDKAAALAMSKGN